jgi:hypothetical protein
VKGEKYLPMSVWSVRQWENEVGNFNYYRSIMVSAVLRMCTTEADTFIQNLRDRVFDLDEVIWIENRGFMASLFIYMMMSDHPCTNLAPHVVRQGCEIDMGRFFADRDGRLVNPMGYAIMHDQQEVVLAMIRRGFSCTAPCAKGGDDDAPGSYVDAIELAIECYGKVSHDPPFVRRMLDTANLSATQLTKYLRGLKPTDAGKAKLFNEAIANARSQEPYYAATWVWKDARETKSEWRDVLHGHVMPVMRALGLPPLYTDPDDARLRGMKERAHREWEEDDSTLREVHMRPNKFRKI